MAGTTKIEWSEAVWNPTRGCSRVSRGCEHCYAETVAARFCGPGQPYEGLVQITTKDRVLRRDFANGEVGLKKVTTSTARWNGKLRFVESALDQPLRWTRPRRVFVNSMSDLFHENFSDEEIAAVFGVMAAAPQHTFQILTKRPERMKAWFEWSARQTAPVVTSDRTVEQHPLMLHIHHAQKRSEHRALRKTTVFHWAWPLSNVWLGVSVEDQKSADERIPILLQTPAAVRFISAEPLLDEIDLTRFMWPVCESWPGRFDSPEAAKAAGATTTFHRQALVSAASRFLDWVIVGGESGKNARTCRLEWVDRIRKDCERAAVPCFVKQLGSNPTSRGLPVSFQHSKAGDPQHWPPHLRVRQYPEARR